MDPLRGDIIQNLIQNLTKFLFRFVSERIYHNYHNYPSNTILTFIAYGDVFYLTQKARKSQKFSVIPFYFRFFRYKKYPRAQGYLSL